MNDASASACAFELLMLNAGDLRRKPYVERKAELRKLLRHSRGIRYVEHAEGHGDRLYEAVCKVGLGGIVSTRRPLSLWSVKDMDQNQKSESTGSYSGIRR